MDLEFILKLIGGIAAALVIAERVYCYSPKVYHKLKGDQSYQSVPAPPESRHIRKALGHNKKNPLVLICRRILSSPYTSFGSL